MDDYIGVCDHGQLRRQCEVCEKDEALSVAWSVLEGQRQHIADLTAKLAEAERERDSANFDKARMLDERQIFLKGMDELRAEVERLDKERIELAKMLLHYVRSVPLGNQPHMSAEIAEKMALVALDKSRA